jgi:DNA-binding NarL/FixJ family response regulator
MKTLLVEDHHMFRQLLSRALENLTGEKCLEASNGVDALNVLKQHRVELVFLDISMPIMDGFETFDRIKKNYPEVKVVLLTQYDAPDLILSFIKKGAHGFILKNADVDEFRNVFSMLASGRKYFSPGVLDLIQDSLDEINTFAHRLQISPQEKLLIELLHQGLTSKELAEKMKLTVKTVNTYREHLFQKTNTKNAAELISFSYQRGLLQ